MKRKGFTLIELLIVIAIIGLLSTLAVVALVNARAKGRDAKRMTDLKQVQTALELYYNDNEAYPGQAESVGTPITNATLGSGSYACLNKTGFHAAGCAEPYMGTVLADPLQSQIYYYSGSSTGYYINATLEGTVNGIGPGVIHINPAGFVEGAGP